MSLEVPELASPARQQKLVSTMKSWLPWVGKGSLAVIDQGIFAGSNFLLNVLLARWLTPAQYGTFALCFSVFLFLGIFHNALLTDPMLVFGSGKYNDRLPQYFGVLLLGHFTLMLPISAVLAATAFLAGLLYSPDTARAFLGLAVGAPFILLLWLLRRAFYVRLNPGWSAVSGGVYFILLVGSALILRSSGRLTPEAGFLAMAAASLVACLILFVLLRPTMQPNFSFIRAVAAEHWRYGKWIAAAAGPGWVIESSYYLLLPVYLGLAEAGALKALMNLAMPATNTIIALGILLVPALVRDRDSGDAQVIKRTVRRCLVLFLLGAGCYSTLLYGYRSYAFQALYLGKYSVYKSCPLVLVGLIPLAQCLTVVVGAALRALEHPRIIFCCSLGGAFATLAVGFPLACTFGITGALCGIAISISLVGILMLVCLARFARNITLEISGT